MTYYLLFAATARTIKCFIYNKNGNTKAVPKPKVGQHKEKGETLDETWPNTHLDSLQL